MHGASCYALNQPSAASPVAASAGPYSLPTAPPPFPRELCKLPLPLLEAASDLLVTQGGKIGRPCREPDLAKIAWGPVTLPQRRAEDEINRQRLTFVQFDLSTGPSQISPNGQPWQATALRQCHGQRGIPTLPRPIFPAQPGFNLHL